MTSVEKVCSAVSQNQARLESAVEAQAQYSRVSTLLFSGKAVPLYRPDENTLTGLLGTIKEYLGITIHPVAISACHRLKNKNSVLLRFLSLPERDAVYRQRIRPRKYGLSVHESLTAERLSVVKLLREMHYPKAASPFHSHYTNRGRIYVRPKGANRAVEIQVEATKDDILALCGRDVHCGLPRLQDGAALSEEF